MQTVDECDGTCDVRSRHRRPTHAQIAISWIGAVDAETGGSQIDRPGSVVGESGQAVRGPGGGNGDDVAEVETAGVVRFGIVVVAAAVIPTVASRHHDNVSCLLRTGNGIV